MRDPRSTYEWQQLSKRAAREEPLCWLQLPGCTRVSVLGDHVVTVEERPDLALVRSNVRGACASCNRKRGGVPLTALRLAGRRPGALEVFD